MTRYEEMAETIIDRILEREGPGNPKTNYTVRGDRGGRTHYGISERAHPEAWRDGPPSMATIRRIYREHYLDPWAWVTYRPLLELLADSTVHHGLPRTVRLLQQAAGRLTVDGVLGPRTEQRVRELQAVEPALLHKALCATRMGFLATLAERDASQRKFLAGWIFRVTRILAAVR